MLWAERWCLFLIIQLRDVEREMCLNYMYQDADPGLHGEYTYIVTAQHNTRAVIQTLLALEVNTV